jgi:hypothetical protein
MEWTRSARQRLSRLLADRFGSEWRHSNAEIRLSGAAKVTAPETILDILLRGECDVRNAVLDRISGNNGLLLEVVRIAESRLRKNYPSQLNPRTRRQWRRHGERFRLVSLVDSVTDRISDKDILYSLAQSSEVGPAAEKRLRALDDPAFLTKYVTELVRERCGSMLQEMALQDRWRKRLPAEALSLIYEYFASRHGVTETHLAHHGRGPGSPGHGTTRPWTEEVTYVLDFRCEMDAIRGELARRETSEPYLDHGDWPNFLERDSRRG